MKPSLYSRFPYGTVLLTNGVSISSYFLAAFILFQIHWIVMFLYIIYILALEFNLVKKHCVHCYYYGKTCGFGRGKLSCFLFEKGDPILFNHKTLKLKNVLPDLLVFIIPVIAAIGLLVWKFSYLFLLVALLFILLSFLGSGYIRPQLACKHCRQRILGCPAYTYFSSSKGKRA